MVGKLIWKLEGGTEFLFKRHNHLNWIHRFAKNAITLYPTNDLLVRCVGLELLRP